MTGAKSAFSELDSGIHGTVKFVDGSVVEIEGHDTILFVGKGGNHHKLTGVYFIPRLKLTGNHHKKRRPNKTWSLEDMPPGTPSHRAQNTISAGDG